MNNDPHGQGLRRSDSRVISILRRVIPGGFSALHEIDHPVLHHLGIDFSDATVTSEGGSRLLPLLIQPQLPVSNKLIKAVLTRGGAWTFVLDAGFGSDAAGALFMCCVMDSPDAFMKAVTEAGGSAEGFMVVHPMRGGQFLFAATVDILKGIIKNGGGRRATEF